MIWMFRVLVILGCPVLGWFQVAQNSKGILVGVVVALSVIAIEILIDRISLMTIIHGAGGAFLGLVSALALDLGVRFLDNEKVAELFQKISPMMKIVLTFLGMVIGVRRQQEIEQLDRGEIVIKGGKKFFHQDVKLLDTSSIIDGRISDVCETKFLSGPFVVPKFVLQELQALADSSDNHKRAKGRRGLEILARLQEAPDIPLKVVDKDYPHIKEVDAKLVQLAKDLEGRIVTTDFNLNKVAALQGISVLNINDLSNALKPVVLPGEGMNIFIVKEGKERDQGIGYLDDGTMVVVEDGRRFLGKRMEVVVGSILQTSAGRMIFTRVKNGRELKDREREEA